MRQQNQSKIGQAKCASIWNEIVERLNWNQYRRYDSMHRGDLSYKTKALIIQKITKDRQTLALADDLLFTYQSYFETDKLAAELSQADAMLKSIFEGS